jgi:hypothetical protein
MNAAQLIGALAEHGAHLAVVGDRVTLRHPAGKQIPAMLVDAARARKAELRTMADRGFIAEAIVVYASGYPAEWRTGLTALDPNRPPPNFPAPWWRGVIRDAQLFLSVWGRQAADLGWTALDLFGVHPKVPAARFSHMGLLLLVNGGRVVVISAESAIIEQQSGSRLTYTRRPPEPECVPLWDLNS